MTIANEKTSEPLVNLIRFCRISGAVHRVTWSNIPEVIDMESWIPATVEWEKSVICAWPESFTRTLDYGVSGWFAVRTWEGVPLLHFRGPRCGSGCSSDLRQHHVTEEGLIKTGINTLGWTYESKSAFLRVLVDVLHQTPARHPIGNELKGGNGGAEEGDDVGVP